MSRWALLLQSRIFKVQNRTTKFILRTSVLCAIGLGLAGCMSADNFSDGTEDPEAGLSGAVQRLLIGTSGSVEPIEYTERGSLVMPPDVEKLPNPEEGDLTAKAENWPEDRRAAEIAKLREFYKVEPGDRLTAEQLEGHRALREQYGERRERRERDYEAERRERELLDGDRLSPDELKELQARYRAAKGEKVAETTDFCIKNPEQCKPQRRYLTEPPLTYSTPVAGFEVKAPEVNKGDEIRARREQEAIEAGKPIDMSQYD
ncbi:hypothetical protein [Pseudovibrio exalbescens]|uniref:hypothetical protein n=1 Tax=Pseudovibrio exalbescens TaxID=197461 RepID=UPI0011611FB0|nr:hypothetical protein [Pseudovibrio exalbescens]